MAAKKTERAAGSSASSSAETQAGSRRRGLPTQPDLSKLTDAALRNAALDYLDHRDGTMRQLERVLSRRVAKYGTPEDAADAKQRVYAVLERLASAQLVDDERYARSLAQSLRLRGSSAAQVRQKLALRGIDREVASRALDVVDQTEGLDDERAAQAFVKRKKLTERHNLADPLQRRKALAALARQGFSASVAQNALGTGQSDED